MDCILNVNKPAGWTSAKAVACVKRKFNVRKAGHCGTLDPRATGVLLVCCGAATKLSARYTGLPKTYRGALMLGLTTDSGDLDGTILAMRRPPDFGDREITDIFSRFTGTITQLPPMYSAVKVNGEELYKKARRGESSPRPPRQVAVYSLTLLARRGFEIEFRCACSKGTYIRTLAEDIGRELGCGAVLTSLVREAVGDYVIADSLPLDNPRP